jgi:sugar phosphate isomerase/epimerase
MRPCDHRPRDCDWLDRRVFLHRLAGILAVASGGSPSGLLRPLTGGTRPTPGSAARRLDRIGIQLYTVRTLMPRDAEGTLAALAAIGYAEVELAGLYGLQPAVMREMLDRHGLAAVSGHMPLVDMRRDWPRALDDAAALGQQYIVCSWIDPSERSADDFRRIADELNGLASTARQHSIRFAYHNHTYEFTPVSGVVPYDILLTRCDRQLVQMEVDLMWMVKAGGDPVAYFDRYPGRFPMVHVKDMTKAGVMADVGQGSIDFRRIFAQSDRAGIVHYFVEHDEPPSPLADARVCYDYLHRLTF